MAYEVITKIRSPEHDFMTKSPNYEINSRNWDTKSKCKKIKNRENCDSPNKVKIVIIKSPKYYKCDIFPR